MSAASQARRRRGRDDLRIVAFERGHFTSYSSCGIPYWVGDVVDGPDRLVSRAPEVFRDDFDMDVRLRHEVTAIDVDRRTVTAHDLEAGREVTEPYDELVYAPGASPIRPDWANGDVAGVFGQLGTVVGGGYIGVEMAEALVRRGLSVT